MTGVSNNPKEVAEAALTFEYEGHKILSDAEREATDPLSKATFHFLADQELKHIEAIKAFARSLAGEGRFETQTLGEPMSKDDANDRIRSLFAQFKPHFEETIWREEGRLQVYDIAMDMERHGYKFYTQAAKLASDETARRFYEFLAEEETKHFEIIQETRDFLAQPDAFMAYEEHWMTT
ncbi:MAG: ferritin-like domain-containing protein [Armatimonadota bacterium]